MLVHKFIQNFFNQKVVVAVTLELRIYITISNVTLEELLLNSSTIYEQILYEVTNVDHITFQDVCVVDVSNLYNVAENNNGYITIEYVMYSNLSSSIKHCKKRMGDSTNQQKFVTLVYSMASKYNNNNQTEYVPFQFEKVSFKDNLVTLSIKSRLKYFGIMLAIVAIAFGVSFLSLNRYNKTDAFKAHWKEIEMQLNMQYGQEDVENNDDGATNNDYHIDEDVIVDT